MHESFKILSAILTVERGIKNLPIFWNGVSLWLQVPSKTGSTFGGLGGTHPPKTYSSTPPPPPRGCMSVVFHGFAGEHERARSTRQARGARVMRNGISVQPAARDSLSAVASRSLESPVLPASYEGSDVLLYCFDLSLFKGL